jgi:hypothetical protein
MLQAGSRTFMVGFVLGRLGLDAYPGLDPDPMH